LEFPNVESLYIFTYWNGNNDPSVFSRYSFNNLQRKGKLKLCRL
jgi:hypothetical protein